MRFDYPTWAAAFRAACSAASETGRRHKVVSKRTTHGWAICPSRRWHVREVSA